MPHSHLLDRTREDNPAVPNRGIADHEILVELVHGLVELVVGVVYDAHVVVCNGIGIVGCKLDDPREVAPDAGGVEVALDSVKAEIEVYVGVVGVEFGELKQLVV